MGTIYRTAQLQELGIERRRREALVRDGTLHRVEHGIYSTSPPEGDTLLRALALTRPHLVYSGATARQIYDNLDITTPLQGLVQRPANYRNTPLLDVHQTRTLPYRTRDNHRVVLPVSAVTDLIDTDPAAARDFLERHYAGRAGNDALATDLSLLGRVSPALRTLVAGSAVAADSNSERRLFRALRSEGVQVIQNFRLGHYHWDGGLPAPWIVIDIDSFRYHAALADGENERTFILDRWKSNDAIRRGWLVLHYTGECVYRHLDKVVEQIKSTIRWRTVPGAPPPEPLPFEVSPPWRWHNSLRVDSFDEPPWPTH